MILSTRSRTFSPLRYVPTGVLAKLLEEPLVEDKRHAADLLHFGLSCGVSVLKVGGDGNGQLPSELLTPETCSHKKAERASLKKSTFGFKA